MIASTVEYDKIPNNVHLSSDRRLQRALEQWQPQYLSWWREMGPQGFQGKDIYLRTAVSVDANDTRHYIEHAANEGFYSFDKLEDGNLGRVDIPLRNGMNKALRDEYIPDTQKCVDKWNIELDRHHIDFRFNLLSKRFKRTVGAYSGAHFSPEGKLISNEELLKNHDNWLPSTEDRAKVQGFMHQVTAPGKVAGWIAPPRKEINGQPLDFTYVQL